MQLTLCLGKKEEMKERERGRKKSRSLSLPPSKNSPMCRSEIGMEQTFISVIYFISQFSVPAQSQDKSVMGLFSVIPAAKKGLLTQK